MVIFLYEFPRSRPRQNLNSAVMTVKQGDRAIVPTAGLCHSDPARAPLVHIAGLFFSNSHVNTTLGSCSDAHFHVQVREETGRTVRTYTQRRRCSWHICTDRQGKSGLQKTHQQSDASDTIQKSARAVPFKFLATTTIDFNPCNDCAGQ